MFYKRLEQGTFEIPSGSRSEDTHVPLNAEQLHLLLYGIELSSVRKRKRFEFPLRHHAVTTPAMAYN
jgi:hypothetical protein